VEVADADDWGNDFEAFRTALVDSAPAVTKLDPDSEDDSIGPYGGFDVTWQSPSAGTMTFGTQADLTVDGAVVPLGDYPRFDNPWTQVPFGQRHVEIADGSRWLVLDFDTWTRDVG